MAAVDAQIGTALCGSPHLVWVPGVDGEVPDLACREGKCDVGALRPGAVIEAVGGADVIGIAGADPGEAEDGSHGDRRQVRSVAGWRRCRLGGVRRRFDSQLDPAVSLGIAAGGELDAPPGPVTRVQVEAVAARQQAAVPGWQKAVEVDAAQARGDERPPVPRKGQC